MRPLALAVMLSALPRIAASQVAPRSIGLELGFTRDFSAVLGDRAPIALTATWWLAGELDATARFAWGFAARPSVRGAAASLEAGGGLRWTIARWSALRPELLAEIALVHAFDAPRRAAGEGESGVRFGAGAAIELFLTPDVSASVSAKASELAFASGEGGPGVAVAMGVAAYF